MYKYKPFYRSVIKNFHSSERYEKLYKYTTRKTIRPSNKLIVTVTIKRASNTVCEKFFVLALGLYSCIDFTPFYSSSTSDEYKRRSDSKFKKRSNLPSAIINMALRQKSPNYSRMSKYLGGSIDSDKFPGTVLYAFHDSEGMCIKENRNHID